MSHDHHLSRPCGGSLSLRFIAAETGRDIFNSWPTLTTRQGFQASFPSRLIAAASNYHDHDQISHSVRIKYLLGPLCLVCCMVAAINPISFKKFPLAAWISPIYLFIVMIAVRMFLYRIMLSCSSKSGDRRGEERQKNCLVTARASTWTRGIMQYLL